MNSYAYVPFHRGKIHRNLNHSINFIVTNILVRCGKNLQEKGGKKAEYFKNESLEILSAVISMSIYDLRIKRNQAPETRKQKPFSFESLLGTDAYFLFLVMEFRDSQIYARAEGKCMPLTFYFNFLSLHAAVNR